MATFLQGATDFFPPEQLFTPNWSLIQQGLMVKQSAYDKGFAQLSGTARAVIDSPLLNKYTKELRSQIIADAEQALKDLPNLDLSLPQNAAEASSLFRPFYEDNRILHDMVQTKQYMSERQRGLELSKSSKEEDRNRYWTYGIQDLDDWAEEFSDASLDDVTKMRSRRYVSKPNVDDQILKMVVDGKLNVKYDELVGQYKYTNENGQARKIPIVNLYLAMAENDPEAMEGFNVIGRVTRNRFIRDNEVKYGSREEAAKAHDNALANDYYNTQNNILQTTEEAMEKLKIKLDGWKQRADNNTLVAGSPDFQQAIEDQKDYDALKSKADRIKGDILPIAGKPAPYLERITNNPTAYLGNVALNKSAIDLATSISQFGSRTIDTNPVYKDLVLPFKLKDYELEKQKQLEQFKTDESLRKTELEYQLKQKYGIPLFDADSNKSSSGNTSVNTPGAPSFKGDINTPTVLETEKGSAGNTLPRDANGQVNTYRLYNEINDDLKRQLFSNKLRFIETVLKPDEIKTIDGVVIPTNKRSDLMNMRINSSVMAAPKAPSMSGTGLPQLDLSSGRQWKGSTLVPDPKAQQKQQDWTTRQIVRSKYDNEFDRLYDLAMTRYKSWAETGNRDPEYLNALNLVTKINNVNDVWTGSIQWKKEKLGEVINNLAGSNPDKAGVYKALLDGASLVSSPDQFLENLKSTPEFNALVNQLVPFVLSNATEAYNKWNRSGVNPVYAQGYRAIMTDPRKAVVDAILSTNEADQNSRWVKSVIPSQYQQFINIANGSMLADAMKEVELTWNKSGNEFNYFSSDNQKGGGVAARRLVFYGKAATTGEDADRFTESLIQTVSAAESEKAGGFSNDYVQFSFNKGNAVQNIDAAEALFQKLKLPLLNTVRLGGKDNITQHTFESSQIAGNDGNWAAYTITPDPKWIQENTSTKETSKLLTKTEAEFLSANGLTIYVKKYDRDDKGNITRTFDNSLAAVETGRVGEVDMLLNANDGTFTREIAPGYKITVSKLATGGYDIITDYIQNEPLPNGTVVQNPKSVRKTVEPSLDLTNAYYSILNSMTSLIYKNEDIRTRVESSRMANPQVPKATWNDVLNQSKQ